MTAEEILRILSRNKAKLRQMGVRKIGLFGSYRRGTSNPESDVDFVVVLERRTFDSYMDVKFFLENLFERDVDLVMEETIKPRLRAYIMEEVVYAQG